jgi:hypothetical protein
MIALVTKMHVVSMMALTLAFMTNLVHDGLDEFYAMVSYDSLYCWLLAFMTEMSKVLMIVKMTVIYMWSLTTLVIVMVTDGL